MLSRVSDRYKSHKEIFSGHKTMWFLLTVALAVAAVRGDEQCKKMPAEDIMKTAQPIAEKIMKKCMHLLDKYPVPLNVIGEALRIMCDDYAKCHDDFAAMASDEEKYRNEISKCVKPHLINFCKSRPEIEHDPEKLATDINECILEHIPLEKSVGIATGIWVMKILGIPVEGA